MPDETSKFSREERLQAAEFITLKAKEPGDPCPHCGNPDTSVGEYMVRLSFADQPIPTRFHTLIPVVCNNCGLVRLFSTFALGLAPLPQTVVEGNE